MGVSSCGPRLTFSDSIFQNRKYDRPKALVDKDVSDGVIISSLPYSRLRCSSAVFGGPAPLPLRTKRGNFKAITNRFARIVVDPCRDLFPYPLAQRDNSGKAVVFGGTLPTMEERVDSMQADLRLALGLETAPTLGKSFFLFFLSPLCFFCFCFSFFLVLFFFDRILPVRHDGALRHPPRLLTWEVQEETPALAAWHQMCLQQKGNRRLGRGGCHQTSSELKLGAAP